MRSIVYSNQKKILFAFAAILGLGFFFIFISKIGQKPAVRPEKGKAVFVLQSEKKTITVGQTVNVALSLITNGEKITAVDSYFEYDPKILEFQKGELGKIFTTYSPLRLKKEGEIYLAGINQKPTEYAKNGLLVKIEFKAKSVGKTKVSLGADSLAAFEGRNVLDLTKLPSLTIIVK